MRTHLALLALFAVFSLGGCATSISAKYQAASDSTGGYSETKLGENMYIVSFYGNSSTSVSQLLDFILLRSAEITLQKGHNYFATIAVEKHDGAHKLVMSVRTVPQSWELNRFWSTGLRSKKRSQSYTYLVIMTFEDKPGPYVYEASRVLKNGIQ